MPEKKAAWRALHCLKNDHLVKTKIVQKKEIYFHPAHALLGKLNSPL